MTPKAVGLEPGDLFRGWSKREFWINGKTYLEEPKQIKAPPQRIWRDAWNIERRGTAMIPSSEVKFSQILVCEGMKQTVEQTHHLRFRLSVFAYLGRARLVAGQSDESQNKRVKLTWILEKCYTVRRQCVRDFCTLNQGDTSRNACARLNRRVMGTRLKSRCQREISGGGDGTPANFDKLPHKVRNPVMERERDFEFRGKDLPGQRELGAGTMRAPARARTAAHDFRVQIGSAGRERAPIPLEMRRRAGLDRHAEFSAARACVRAGNLACQCAGLVRAEAESSVRAGLGRPSDPTGTQRADTRAVTTTLQRERRARLKVELEMKEEEYCRRCATSPKAASRTWQVSTPARRENTLRCDCRKGLASGGFFLEINVLYFGQNADKNVDVPEIEGGVVDSLLLCRTTEAFF
ncbi:hypothetical protein C8R43DRAFT_963236 [Mycena crocata]|nr:hypothetical protein C8R43DRAFT_963236 [Mycena crocata]